MRYKDYELPDDVKYHKEHCWARLEGTDELVIGWTDFAQRLAEDISAIMVPEAGEKIQKDQIFGSIETGKWVGKLYAPVDGEILELNEDVLDDPRIINNDPYGNGWIMKLKLSDPSQLEKLLESGAYTGVIEVKLKELEEE